MAKEIKIEETKIQDLKKLLDQAEKNLISAKKLFFEELLGKRATALGQKTEKEGKIVEGVFDGESMIGADEKKYPIPPNYASKSKLVTGDVLKLTVLDDGTFIYKQIGPVERKRVIGTLEKEDNQYFVNCKEGRFQLLLASVTYLKAEPGDELTVIIPKTGGAAYAALENVFKRSK